MDTPLSLHFHQVVQSGAEVQDHASRFPDRNCNEIPLATSCERTFLTIPVILVVWKFAIEAHMARTSEKISVDDLMAITEDN